MKAIIINAYGSPDVLQESIVPFPKVGPRQVLIKIKAAGVNPIDWKIRKYGRRPCAEQGGANWGPIR
jgi:NADPH:quinone reductase-like Zn-dependent oxidoreductase